MRLLRLTGIVWTLALAGCLGPVSLHQAVLRYDETVSRLESEMLLLNIARTHHNLPAHFTVTSSIAATFDYRANFGIGGEIHRESGASFLAPSLGVSAAENPTLSIVPVQGEDFTRRILTPMDESKLGFLVIQGAPIDMVLRLMADGVEVQDRQGNFERFILNRPTKPREYEEFRRLVMHLAWLNANRQLFVGRTTFEEDVTRATLTGPPSAADLMASAEKGYQWNRVNGGPEYALTRRKVGRGMITNYNPHKLTDADRRALNDLASENPENFILVDLRPGYPGGDFPLFGAFKLRSLNVMIEFLASGISQEPEFDVAPDPRTPSVSANPRRVLAIEESDSRPSNGISVFYQGKYYAVADRPWDRQAFKLLSQLFQMTVTDVSRVAVPAITISK